MIYYEPIELTVREPDRGGCKFFPNLGPLSAADRLFAPRSFAEDQRCPGPLSEIVLLCFSRAITFPPEPIALPTEAWPQNATSFVTTFMVAEPPTGSGGS